MSDSDPILPASLDELVEASFGLLSSTVGVGRHDAAVRLARLADGRSLHARVDRRGAVVVVGPGDGTWAQVLSPRERQVATCLARGLTNREIAAELFVSVATVKDHVHHILTKTGLTNRAAVAGRWRAPGLGG